MKHKRTLSQKLTSYSFFVVHTPPKGVYLTGDLVSWSGVDGVVVSASDDKVQALFPPPAHPKGLIVSFTKRGEFFTSDESRTSLLFISRPRQQKVEEPKEDVKPIT